MWRVWLARWSVPQTIFHGCLWLVHGCTLVLRWIHGKWGERWGCHHSSWLKSFSRNTLLFIAKWWNRKMKEDQEEDEEEWFETHGFWRWFQEKKMTSIEVTLHMEDLFIKMRNYGKWLHLVLCLTDNACVIWPIIKILFDVIIMITKIKEKD